jgi:hypothetical protein
MLPNEIDDAPAVVACWMWASVRAATSERRKPQPRRMASIARSRSPFFVAVSGALRSACACRSDSQFPTRTPFDLAPLTRVMPTASSGSSSPLSAASTASLRTAVMRTLIETEPSLRSSRAPRQAFTVAFVKPGRGSRPYHSMNSSRPRLYTLFVIGEETLSKTRAFSLRQSAARFDNTRSFIFSPFSAAESARYWGISAATWTIALERKDIKTKRNSCPLFKGLRGKLRVEILLSMHGAI